VTIAVRPGAGQAALDLVGALEAVPGPPGSLRAVTLAVDEVDPIGLLEAAREADLEAALWLQPAGGFALVGIGRAWSVEPAGPGRFAVAAAAWRDLLRGATLLGAEPGPQPAAARGAGPILLGGLGFSGARPADGDLWGPFGAASLVLPSLTLARTPAGSYLTAALVEGPAAPALRSLAQTWDTLAAQARRLAPAPGAVVARPASAPLAVVAEQPDRRTWHRLVGLFAGAVGRGRLDKVVLARRVDVRSPLELDTPNALRRLAAGAPEGTIFAFARGAGTFIGATPERLVRTEGRAFQSVAIAGTAPRGADPAEDERLAAALLASEKEREEHAVVAEMLRSSLAPLAQDLQIGDAPAVLRLRDVQHLVTQVSGTLRKEAGLLALAERLHPTPAVGGEPLEPALELIAEHEGFDRGWYAGPVGWLGVDGDGELMVALRCGLVDGRAATLYAGCGIVADSDPAREWGESLLKLRPVASALGRLEEADR
jgi:isochorismate synthase